MATKSAAATIYPHQPPFEESPSMRLSLLCSLVLLVLVVSLTPGKPEAPARQRPPHGQDRLPGPALTPAEALRKMQVPEGFRVELVASEPDIVNPVAMTFDEKGRIWITESLEYPRRSAGPGRDRVKVLEDTDGDGKIDKVTVFAEGLNIPSGIAVGHGGVWVANSPDILFYRIGPDGKAAGKPEVVVTGFGRDDTHELPNTLTWGPDGWLYGLNGVFNSSHVKHNGKEWRFTCALFRIHPKTREFQVFCEGTSNPWGLAIDGEGSFFVSACVIDHLWHLAETGYYHRQGGPYPPFTWKLGSIVRHRHQKAAYCGLVWFDSDAYPPAYREKLYMGNIHGGCINSDVLSRDGSTYFARPRPDFLTANDAWFMPVSQKVGPDGCLYILDWYDRYHCYQDANRDPAGIDRKNGRLYRVRYKDSPRAAKFDLAKESDERLIERLSSPNVYFRDLAQRLLSERGTPEVKAALEKVVLDDTASRKGRMHALWALIGAGDLDAAFHRALLAHKDPAYRAWAVRAAGNQGKGDAKVPTVLAKDNSRDVQLQVAIAARKVRGVDPIPMLLDVLSACGDDKLIPAIVWQNLHPLLEDHADQFLQIVRKHGDMPNLGQVLPRAIERILAARKPKPAVLAELFSLAAAGKAGNQDTARQVLGVLATKIQNGEVAPEQVKVLQGRLLPVLRKEMARGRPLRVEAALLAATFRDPKGLAAARGLLGEDNGQAVRIRALETLCAVRDGSVLDAAGKLLVSGKGLSVQGRGQVLAALGWLEDERVAPLVLAAYAKMEPDLRPRAVELLTQRTAWGKALLKAIADKKLAPGVLNVNQARRLLDSKDADLVALVTRHWGTIRSERNPEREKVVAQMRALLQRTKGDAKRGIVVYRNLCGQCHKLHGEGTAEVGPDITSNGRASFEQLLSNVFDPSLVVGPGYQAVTVLDDRGRSLTGLLVEDSPARVVLRVQGGKQEVIARKKIDKIEVSKLSLMPEGIEKQLKPQEIADLFAFIVLDRHPNDPKARRIPGTPRGL
jgi:putative heme-binding domain-containing protein